MYANDQLETLYTDIIGIMLCGRIKNPKGYSAKGGFIFPDNPSYNGIYDTILILLSTNHNQEYASENGLHNECTI